MSHVAWTRLLDRLGIQERAEAEARRRFPVHFASAFEGALTGVRLAPVARR